MRVRGGIWFKREGNIVEEDLFEMGQERSESADAGCGGKANTTEALFVWIIRTQTPFPVGTPAYVRINSGAMIREVLSQAALQLNRCKSPSIPRRCREQPLCLIPSQAFQGVALMRGSSSLKTGVGAMIRAIRLRVGRRADRENRSAAAEKKRLVKTVGRIRLGVDSLRLDPKRAGWL